MKQKTKQTRKQDIEAKHACSQCTWNGGCKVKWGDRCKSRGGDKIPRIGKHYYPPTALPARSFHAPVTNIQPYWVKG